jgi:hypothetical protein
MNHPSQFAQPFSWGIAAKAADAGPLLPASAATSFDHDQILPHGLGWGSPAKLGMLGSHAAIPVRVNLFRGQGILPERLGRRRIAGGPFGRLSGCVNTQLAKPINHPLSAERLKNFAKGSKCHSKVSVRYGPEPKRDGAQKNGNGSQEYGVS